MISIIFLCLLTNGINMLSFSLKHELPLCYEDLEL